MSLFERFRSSGPVVAGGAGIEADISEREALRLVDEGNSLEDAGRPAEALERYEAAIRLAPNLARAHLNRGNALQASGNIEGALESFATAIAKDPGYAGAHYNMGMAYLRSGRPGDARAAFESTLALKPELVDAEVGLGCSLEELRQLDAAAESYRRALAIAPGYAEVHANLGNVLSALGQPEEALASYRAAVEIKPAFAEWHLGVGKALQDLQRPDEAAASYRRAIEINPDLAAAHSNLGNVLLALGRIDAAAESFRRALSIDADLGEAHYRLGNILIGEGRINEAVASYNRALQSKPDVAAIHCNLGNALLDIGRLEDAVVRYREAVRIDPAFAVAWSNLGNAQNRLRRLDDAVASYRRALEIDPGYAEAHCNLGTSLRGLHQFGAAEASYRRALELKPDFADAHGNLAVIMHDLGRLEEAQASFRRALEIKPDFAQAYSNALFCASHREGMSAGALFVEHRGFGERFETPLRASWPQHRNKRDPARRLQVGFVSADLRDHAVACFIEPVLAHLAGSAALSLHAYHNHSIEDPVTKRLRQHFGHWHGVVGLRDAALAEKIRNDEIDILIDLSGHTAENRLLTFARKPAPVQASWIGYPGTTGLEAVDYYLADRYFLPPGRFDSQFTEKLVYLPALAPFLPDMKAPPVNGLPALRNGYVTFGSFNRLTKLRPSVVALWSRLLKTLPDARMLLGGMPRDASSNPLIDWFAKEGIARERLSFHPRSDITSYLALHHQVDMCLDTFPYTGGTTTNYALWMGVPTLTLAGQTAPGRQGAANLGHVGLDGFVAEDAEDFQAKGLSWAQNIAGLADVRAGLRDRWQQSPVRQPELIAAGVESALRTMWQRWCAGLPPDSFDVATSQSTKPSR